MSQLANVEKGVCFTPELIGNIQASLEASCDFSK